MRLVAKHYKLSDNNCSLEEMIPVRQLILIILAAGLVGCGHYRDANFRVVNAQTGMPVEGAKLTAVFIDGYSITLTDLIRPQWSYTQAQEAKTGADGIAAMKVPLGRTTGLGVTSPDGRKLDPQDHARTTVTAQKNGFRDASVSHTNNEW